MFRTQGEGDRGKEDKRRGTEGAGGVWGGKMWAGDVDLLLPPKRAGIKSCMVVPEPKWSHSRCSVNILRVNINRGDDSGSCSQWEIFYHVYKSCFCACFGYKVSFLEIAFALWCPLGNECLFPRNILEIHKPCMTYMKIRVSTYET